MKSVFVSYNQAFHEEILDILNKTGLRGYTSWEQVQGKGSHTGDPHLGDHAWPTLNSAMLCIVEDRNLADLLGRLKELDQTSPAMGLRAFSWNIEESI